MGKPKNTCRVCGDQLKDSNARRYDGRFVGICRPCESDQARERAIASGRMTGSRYNAGRKYPIPS